MKNDSSEIQVQLNPTVVAVLERLAVNTSRVLNHMAPALLQVGKFLADLEQTIGVPLPQLAQQIEKRMTELPAIIRTGLLEAAQHGWHPGGEMPMDEMEALFDMFASGNFERADELMSEFITECIPSLKEDIRSQFPERWPILEAAFCAHEKGEYVLAIPVFLSQSEGIWRDKINASWFLTKVPKGEGCSKPETFKFVLEQEAIDDFASAFLAPMKHEIPLNQSKKNRKPDFAEMNRHRVLHGEDVHYGTRLNSLKAISLLQYAKFATIEYFEQSLSAPLSVAT